MTAKNFFCGLLCIVVMGICISTFFPMLGALIFSYIFQEWYLMAICGVTIVAALTGIYFAFFGVLREFKIV